MKKISLSIVILFTIQSLTIAQKIEWGKEQENYASNWAYYAHLFLTENEDYFYMQQIKGNRVLFTEQFAWNLTLKKKLEPSSNADDSKYKGVGKELVLFFDHSQHTYALYKAKDIDKKIYYYFIEKMDIETGRMSFEKELYAIKYEEDTPTGHFDLDFYFSPDESKLLAKFYPKNDDKTIINYTLTVFDEEFEKMWEETIKLPQEEVYKYYKERNVLLSNNGDVFIMGRFNNRDIQKYIHKSKAKVFPRYDHQLIGIYNDGKDVKYYTIGKEKGIRLNRYEPILTKENNLLVYGFYEDKAAYDRDEILGNYHMLVNAETQEKDIELFLPFKTENFSTAINNTLKNRTPEKNKESAYAIKMGNIYSGEDFLTEDGTLYRAIRHFEKVYYGDNEKITVKSLYIFRIMPNGTVDWIREIPLLGRAVLELHVTKNNSYVLFDDHVKNIDLTANNSIYKVPSNKGAIKNNGCFMLMSFDTTGKPRRKTLEIYKEKITGGISKVIDVKKDSNTLLIVGETHNEKSRFIGLLKLE